MFRHDNIYFLKNSKQFLVFDLTLQMLHHNLNYTIPLSTLIFFVRSILSVMETLWALFESHLHPPWLLTIRVIPFSGMVIKHSCYLLSGRVIKHSCYLI